MPVEIRDVGRNNDISVAAATTTGACEISVDGNDNTVLFEAGSDVLLATTIAIKGSGNTINIARSSKTLLTIATTYLKMKLSYSLCSLKGGIENITHLKT